MKIELAQKNHMSQDGKSLLKLIMSHEQKLDLLVRESVQNSLDAKKEKVKNVKVSFKTGQFRPIDVNGYFEGISDALNERYETEKKADYIAVRDSNTVGLTGPVRLEDTGDNKYGNFLKLVYEIGKPQEAAGAGGSWGLGKTVYYRVGIGLVIYYSRFEENGEYCSRMSACLVENQDSNNTMIPYSGSMDKMGIAWWGKEDPKKPGKTIPVDDEYEIKTILDAFKIDPYENEQTGTTVIIPYVSRENLLNEINVEGGMRPYWTKDVDEYLLLAIQKWYAPRLSKDFPFGPYLSADVNGQEINTEDMLPLFRVVQELYLSAINIPHDEEELTEKSAETVLTKPINIISTFKGDSKAGVFAHITMSPLELLMKAPDNQPDPFVQLTNSTQEHHYPIVAYTRKPGMIVGYDFKETWIHGVPEVQNNNYLIGLFVPKSANELLQLYQDEQQKTIEDYLRRSEMADHTSWTDFPVNGKNLNIIERIKKNISNELRARLNIGTEERFVSRNTGLRRALADLLLPRTDFGYEASPRPTRQGGGGGGGNRAGKTKFVITGNPEFREKMTILNFELYCRTTCCEIAAVVPTDIVKLNADKWESEDAVGKEFPLRICGMIITHVAKIKSEKQIDMYISSEQRTAEESGIRIQLRESGVYGTDAYIKVRVPSAGIRLTGRILLQTKDATVGCDFVVKEAGHE